jgi:hypothetical protein
MYGHRDGWICHLCLGRIDENPSQQYENDFCSSPDHFVPVARGGLDFPSNIKAAHLTCNKGRRDRSPEEYRAAIKTGKTAAQTRYPERFTDLFSEESVNDSHKEREREREGIVIGKESILPADAGLSKPNGHKEAFEDFWKLYPTDKNMSKKTAKTQWAKLSPEKQFAAIGAVPGFRQYCEQNKWYRPLYADRFLAQERFEGYAAEPQLSPEVIADQKDRADKLMRRGKYSTGP